MSDLCKNCNGTSRVNDALGNIFFCPKCYTTESRQGSGGTE